MKKLLLLFTVCAVLTSCASAGTKPESDSLSVNESSDGETSVSEISSPESHQLQLTDCYKSEVIQTPHELMYIYDVTAFSGSEDVIVTGVDSSYENTLYYKTDRNFSAFTPFEYEYPEESAGFDHVSEYPLFNPDGTFSNIFTFEDHNGITIEKVRNGEYDYDDYNENCISSYMLCTYNKDGNIVKKTKFEYPESFYDENYGYIIFNGVTSYGDSVILIDQNNVFWKLSPDGEFSQMYTYENEADAYYNNFSFANDRDGRLVCVVMSNITTEDESYTTAESFYEVTDSGLSEKPFYTSDRNSGCAVSAGYGKYRLFIPSDYALYGLTDDGELESVINWSDSNTEQMYVIATGENEFAGIGDNNSSLLKLTPRDMSELENTKIITIASPSDDLMFLEQNTINRFNNMQTDYRIKVVEIDADNEEGDFYSARNALNLMVIKGEAPDIFYGLDYSTFVNYRQKDIFADLYSFIDSDSDISREDFMPNVISALETPENELFGICGGFSVRTLMTKTSVWNKENWTLDEFIKAHDDAPDSFSHLYDGTTKIEILNQMTYAMTDFIDYENAVCHFDSPDFIKILEFCNRFVDEVDKPSKDNYEAFSNYHSERFRWLGSEEILYETGSPFSYNFIKYLQADGDDLTFAGYPSSDGRGGLIIPDTLLCISSDCENKQGAWEFIKFYIQNSDSSILNDKFEKALDNKLTEKSTANGIEIPVFDKQTRDMVEEYIRSCSKLGTSYDSFNYPAFDNDIMTVMEEEAGSYFAGEQSVETASDNIQKRISIIVSERN